MLAGATLAGARMARATLPGARLPAGATLAGARMARATLPGARLPAGATLAGARMPAGATLAGARMPARPTLAGAMMAVAPPTMGPVAAPGSDDLQQATRAAVLIDLEQEDRNSLLDMAQRFDLAPGQVLLAPGQPVEHLYIVLTGELLLVENGRSAGAVTAGEAIEPLAVLRGGPCSYEVRAPDDVVSVLQIEASAVREIVATDPDVGAFIERPLAWPGAARFRQRLRDYGVMRDCAIDLIAAMTLRVAPAGTRLAGEGTPVPVLRIINKGTVSASKTFDGVPAPIAQLGEGTLFGGVELSVDKPYSLSYDAVTSVELLDIDREVVLDLLQRAPELATLLEAFTVFGRDAAAQNPDEVRGEEPPDDDADAPPVSTFRKQGGTPPLRRPRPYFVEQHDEMDCGAACLAMVSGAYGRKISLATYRSKLHVTREGASMWSVVRAARDSGFAVVGVNCGAEGLANLHLPAIAMTQYHFVVVYKLDKTGVLVGDPAIGLRQISIEAFKAEFSGILMLMRPTEKFFAQNSSPSGWRKYLALAPGHVRPALEILLASFLQFAFGIATPVLTQVAFDRVLVTGSSGLLTTMVIGMAVVTVLSTLTGVLRGYFTGYIANRFDTVFSALVYRYVMRLPLNFFMVRRVGDILTRFREIQNVRQFLTGDALNALIQVTSIGIYIVILFLYSTALGLLALGLTPLVAFTSVACSRKLRRMMQEAFAPQAQAQGLIVEQLRSLDTVKALGAEVAGRWRWEEAFRNALRMRLRIDKLRVLINAVSVGMQQLALTALLYASARMAIHGEVSVGTVIAVGMFAAAIFTPVQTLAAQWTNLQTVAVGLGRIDDVLTTSAEPSYEAPSAGTRRLQGDIELRNVWFQYGSDLSPWVLKDVSLTIKRGETVAFVGRSGSGKTTLVQLLNLLYRPTRGTVLVDGKDITTIDLGQLRDSIGMVMQDSHLFAGTVFDNIAFGQDNASLELVMAAARVANAQGFVSTMKDGYYTRLKEGGGGLSGGQRQRINLARALFRRPTILILDEATSALDSEGERAIVEAMKVYCRGRTSILIAHRLSTVLHADKIVLLDGGRVVEVGSHRELIARGGAYVQLFGAQLAL
jgi:ATP-binding cassette subfamily B protein